MAAVRPAGAPCGAARAKAATGSLSLEAQWVAPETIHELPLRHPEVVDLVALALADPPSMQLVA